MEVSRQVQKIIMDAHGVSPSFKLDSQIIVSIVLALSDESYW